jgi:hypothetical protein
MSIVAPVYPNALSRVFSNKIVLIYSRATERHQVNARHWHAMRIILYVYTAIYVLFSISVIVDDIKDKHPWWRTGSDAALFAIASLGIVFYFLALKNDALILAWKPISLILLAGQMMMNFYERNLILAGKDADIDHRKLTRGTVWATDLFAMFLVLPATIINLIFAFF